MFIKNGSPAHKIQQKGWFIKLLNNKNKILLSGVNVNIFLVDISSEKSHTELEISLRMVL